VFGSAGGTSGTSDSGVLARSQAATAVETYMLCRRRCPVCSYAPGGWPTDVAIGLKALDDNGMTIE
jgi:hypothetical protein